MRCIWRSTPRNFAPTGTARSTRSQSTTGSTSACSTPDGKYLYLQKQKIDQEKTDFTLTVDKPPSKAGIDPMDKLIDRNPDDNVIAVKKK